MPRASDYLLEGYTYHLTHRCQERQFLLRAGRYRSAYRKWLSEGVQRYGVPVYGYCITRNHVRVVAHASKREAISRMMQLASGATAKGLNVRKDRVNAMWEHPYHCTVIQDGRHLLNCLQYVDLNMVRAGRVRHPDEWKWCGYDELSGQRQRYRILNVGYLAERVGLASARDFHAWYVDAMSERLKEREQLREPQWTESVAVGSDDFVSEITGNYPHRFRFSINRARRGAWAVREAPVPYGTKKS